MNIPKHLDTLCRFVLLFALHWNENYAKETGLWMRVQIDDDDEPIDFQI